MFFAQHSIYFIKSIYNSTLVARVHSIECDYIPKPGDDVDYKKCLVPPKNEKYSAVHVKVIVQCTWVKVIVQCTWVWIVVQCTWVKVIVQCT